VYPNPELRKCLSGEHRTPQNSIFQYICCSSLKSHPWQKWFDFVTALVNIFKHLDHNGLVPLENLAMFERMAGVFCRVVRATISKFGRNRSHAETANDNVLYRSLLGPQFKDCCGCAIRQRLCRIVCQAIESSLDVNRSSESLKGDRHRPVTLICPLVLRIVQCHRARTPALRSYTGSRWLQQN
jgi:hypothetical protein